MHEVVNRLPVTFTGEDVGRSILLNTGCWVAKFDMEWAKKVRFTVNDRIIYSRKENKFSPQVESEDWYFSRLLHELDLKLGATRIIDLEHIGRAGFPNNKSWGTDKFDVQVISRSVLDEKEDDGFEYPEDVDGWLMPSEARALANVTKGKRVLEIGAYCGLSTICMARTAESVDSIDPHDGRQTPRPKDTYEICCDNLERYGVADKVTLHKTIDKGVVDGQKFEVIFIDGDHEEEGIQTDIRECLELLEDDGVMVFHDYENYTGQYSNSWDPAVTKAVDDFVADGAIIISRTASLVVIRPPALKPLEV